MVSMISLPLPLPLHLSSSSSSSVTNFFSDISSRSNGRRRRIRSSSSSMSTPSPSSFVSASLPHQKHHPQKESTLASISQSRIIACVRWSSGDIALDMARAALDGGLNVLEVTMNTPGALKAIATLVDEYPSAVIGAGTVLSTLEANSAKDVGAKFLMSPITMQKLIEAHCCEPTLIIPGAITPNEVFNAFNWGACLVKLYPITIMGGLKLVEAIRKPMPSIPLVASQGIALESIEQYFIAGVTAVVLSDAIFNKALVEAKDFRKIKKLAAIAAEKAGHFHGVQ